MNDYDKLIERGRWESREGRLKGTRGGYLLGHLANALATAQRDAWDEGYDSGHQDTLTNRAKNAAEIHTRNPHREEA